MKPIYIILIIVVLIVVIYFIVKKNKPTEIQNPVQSLITNSGLSNIISSGNTPTNTNTNTNANTTTTGNYTVGTSLYSKVPLNIYNTPDVTQSANNIKTSYDKDVLLGTFVSYDNSKALKMIKIYTDEWFLSTRVAYVRADQVYSK